MDGDVVETFKYRSASAVLIQKDKEFWLRNVYSEVRGKGHGTELMRLVCEYADAHHLDLDLEVIPYKSVDQNTILNEELLFKFYEKFGFHISTFNKPTQMMRLRRD